MCSLFRNLPDVPALRKVYSSARHIVKRPYFFSSPASLTRSVAEEADIDAITAEAGIAILCHMELIQVENQVKNCRLIVPEMVKRDPETDPVYQKLAKWRQTAWEGGAVHE